MAKKTNSKINGKNYFRVRTTIGKDRDGKNIVKNFYGSSKREAEAKRDKWQSESYMGLNHVSDKDSLSMAMYTWLWEIERMSGNKASTFERYEGIYRNYIEKSKIGYINLGDIQRITLQKYYNELYACGKTHSQIFNTHKLLNKFFKYALMDGYVLRNPCLGMKLDKYKENQTIDNDILDDLEDEGKIEAFTQEEVKLILNSIENKKLRIMIKFALATGLRQGEILALKQSDVKDMVVYVTKTIRNAKVYGDNNPNEYHYELKVTKPKSKKSKRKVPIPSSLEKDLKELNIIRNIEKLKIGEAYNDNGLLFPSETGTYIDKRNLYRAWGRIFKHVDVPFKKFHSLRHTFATQLIKNGSQLITVSRLLGHASIKTTEIYAHVLESTKQKDVESLNVLFN